MGELPTLRGSSMAVGAKVDTALETCESTREGVTLTPSGTTVVELTATALAFGTPGELPRGVVGCNLRSVVGPGPGVAAGGGVPDGSGNMALHRSVEQHPTRQSKEPVQNSEWR